MSQLLSLKSWQALDAHFQEIQHQHLRDLFQQDSQRSKTFSIQLGDLYVDYSKNRINTKTLQLFKDLAQERHLSKAINAMFQGEIINNTEKRAVLHIALRNRSNRPILVNGKDVMPDINKVLAHMKSFCHQALWP